MNDLYGFPMPGLTDDTVPNMPNLLGDTPSSAVNDYIEQLRRLHGVQFVDASGNPVSASVAPKQQAPQQLGKITTWPKYKADAPAGADPGALYDLYVDKVFPNEALSAGYSSDQVVKSLEQFKVLVPRPNTSPQIEPAAPQKGTKTGLDAAQAELQSSIAGYKAGFAAIPAALGFGDADYKRLKKESDDLRAQSSAPGSFEEMEFGENFLPYLRQLAIGFLPYMVEFAAGAGVGSIAAGALRLGVREAAANAVRIAAEQGAESAASIAAQKAAAEAVLKLAGRATTVGAVTSYPSSVGQLLTAQDDQKQKMDIALSAALGIPYAWLNKFGGIERIIGNLTAGNFGRSLVKNPLARGAVGGLTTAAQEGGQELAQQVLEEVARAAVDPSYTIDDKVIARLKESAIGGALLGGIPGAAVGAFHKPALAHGGAVTDTTVPPVTTTPAAPVTNERPVLSEEDLIKQEIPGVATAAATTTAPAPTLDEVNSVQDFNTLGQTQGFGNVAERRAPGTAAVERGVAAQAGNIEPTRNVLTSENEDNAIAQLVATQMDRDPTKEATANTEQMYVDGLLTREQAINALVAAQMAQEVVNEQIKESVTPTAQADNLATSPAPTIAAEPGSVAATSPSATVATVPEPGTAAPTQRRSKLAGAPAVQQAVGVTTQTEPAGSIGDIGRAEKLKQGTGSGERGPEGVVGAVNPAVAAKPVVPPRTTKSATGATVKRGAPVKPGLVPYASLSDLVKQLGAAIPDTKEKATRKKGSGLKQAEADKLAPKEDLDAVRFATSEDQIPLDAISYISKDGATVQGVLNILDKSNQTPLGKVIIRTLKSMFEGTTEIPISFVANLVDGKGQSLVGHVNRGDVTTPPSVNLNPNGGTTTRTVLHEITHVLTHLVLDGTISSPEKEVTIKQLNDMWTRAEMAAIGTPFEGHYGFKNLHEFISEAFSNPEFQHFLSTIPWNASPLTRKSVWQTFKEVIARVLSSIMPGRERTVLYNALVQSVDLFHAPGTSIFQGEVDHRTQQFAGVGLDAVDRTKPYLTYDVYDTRTGQTVSSYTNKMRSRNQVDKLDNEYGGVRYGRRERIVMPDGTSVNPSVGNFFSSTEQVQYLPKVDLNQERKQEKSALNELEHTPKGAILGNDKEDGQRTHIAYPRKDGNYDLYEITDPTTAEGLKGDPETRLRNVPESVVNDKIQTAGSDTNKNTREDFGGPPKNNATQITKWKDGAWQFAAYKQADGKWNIYTGDDLHNRALPRTKAVVEDVDNVEQAFAGKDYSNTEKQSLARQRQDATADMTKVEYTPPSQPHINFADLSAPRNYLGYQIAKALEKANNALPEALRLDYLNILKNSYAQTKLESTIEHETKPLMRGGVGLMKKWGWNEAKLSDFHRALVVAERNPKIRNNYTADIEAKYGQKNRDAEAEALRTLSTLTPQQRADLEAYAREWKKYSNKTVDINQDGGFLSAKSADNIKKAYNFYVPLGDKTSRTIKTATGQSSTAESIYAKLQKQRYDSIVAAVDNKAKQQLLEVLEDYTNNIVSAKTGEKMFEIGPILKLKRDPATGRIDETLDPLTMNRNSIVVYRDGQPIRILVNDKDMVKAFDSFPNRDRNTMLQRGAAAAAMFNYVYGSTKTLLSPVFAVRNFARDMQTAFAQLDPDIPYHTFVKNVFSPQVWEAAIREGFSATIPSLLDGNTRGAKLAREATDAGALVSRKHMLGQDQLNHNVATALDPGLWGKTKEFIHFEGPLFGFLSGITKTLENATRMSIYAAGREAGLSEMRAGVAAKTGTVNFEPKGSASHVINPLYVFANAKIQGVRTLGQNLGFAPGVQEANRRTQVAAGLAVFAGLAAGAILWQNSDKDKDGKKRAGKIPDYKRDGFMIFDEHKPGVPIPQELGAFYVMGNALADYIWGDKEDKGQSATARFATNMIQNFWPSGSAQYDPIGAKSTPADYGLRMVLPTPFLLAYDISTNKTTFGSEIVQRKEDLIKRGVPSDEMGNRNSSRLGTFMAKQTFGAPQQWDYIAKQMVGPQTDMVKWIMGSPPDYKDQRMNPFTKTFMPDVSPYADRDSFDTIHQKIEEAHTRWAKATFENRPQIYEKFKKELQLYPSIHGYDNQIRALFKNSNKMTPERRTEAEDKASEIRSKALKRYYDVMGVQ